MAIPTPTPDVRMSATGFFCGGGSRAHNSMSIAYRLEEFRNFIASRYGLALIGQLQPDGYFHGLKTDLDRHGGRPFRYSVHLDPPQNVFYTDLKRNFSGVWFPEGGAALSLAEREHLRREAEARRLRRDAEIRAVHLKAAIKARALWRSAVPALPHHPYLIRKHIDAHGVRFLPVWQRRIEREPGRFEWIRVERVLLVPMRNQHGQLWSVQAIFPEHCPELGRDKDFLPGSRKKGLFHWLGPRTATICLVEGFGTGCSVFEATGYRTVVCFDAGNLPVVAEIVRGILPETRIVVCADHDQAGLEKGREAAERVDGFLAVPPTVGADFNDWAVSLKEVGHGR
ncbi:toprim domain-containing protein [Methylomagnum ishizawai]|uniref:toprim domain-containing protein n=1 Tax=Methylomagnum ishizawai TaxID=1760988 RepID=UPI001C3307B4|nr:toprim domain-containing protein [Methylomagnum ishizawai]BBL73008.1 hypothetical protein MishRS11D_01060 [Methylomagnum ishizawai]